MNKIRLKMNPGNEQVKRQYFDLLRYAKGRAEGTIAQIEKALWLFEEFSSQADFSHYTKEKAMEFKQWLNERRFRGKPLTETTYTHYLRYLGSFFTWLSQQQGFKNKITIDAVEYLNPSDKQKRMARQVKPRSYPEFEYCRDLALSIKGDSEIDHRDRALISFIALTGMRDLAVTTLSLGSFSEEDGIVEQNPRSGVRTKGSKHILSPLYAIDERLVLNFVSWAHLLKKKGFPSEAPLFPRSKKSQGQDNSSFETPTEVEPHYWIDAGPIRTIFKYRSKQAGLAYYPPHTFRHSMIAEAWKYCRTPEELKALSQSVGHENLMTTVAEYAAFDRKKLARIAHSMDFSKEATFNSDAMLETMKKMLEELTTMTKLNLEDKRRTP